MKGKASTLRVVGAVVLPCVSLAGAEPADKKEGRAISKVIHLKVSLACKPEEAFAYFTDPKKLTTWLTEAAVVEPKVGGRFELYWEPANREQNSTIGCRVTAIEPNE